MTLFRWTRLALPFAFSLVFACGNDEVAIDVEDTTETPSDSSQDGDGDGNGNEDGNGDGNDGSPQQPASKVATVRVHYPVGSRTLLLKGERAPLTSAGTPLKDVSNDTWELSLGEIDAAVSFTPTLDGKDARGPAYSVSPGQTLDIYPHFEQITGKIAALPAFASTNLNNQRTLRIYLPPSYDENTIARYPVIYMHDGQVLFEGNLGTLDAPAKAAFGSWRAEKVVDEGVEKGTFPEVIVVGVDLIIKFDPLNFLANLTEIREQELTPTNDESVRKGSGKGPQYLKMIAEEIKPMIDKNYRTVPDREHTFIGGSSLGGLISIWAGLDHGDVFGGVLAMSSSTWWDKEVATQRVAAENGGPKRTLKVYSDIGDAEDAEVMIQTNERLWKAYRDVGYVDDQTLKTDLSPGGQHNGQSWTKRLPTALQFLLGSGR